MTNQIKNFIENGEKLFDDKFELDYDGRPCFEISEIKQFISSRQISLIKMIVENEMQDVEKAIKWANDPYTKGYSQSWLSGYQKAYEQVKNDLDTISSKLKK